LLKKEKEEFIKLSFLFLCKFQQVEDYQQEAFAEVRELSLALVFQKLESIPEKH
jgi:hypothetical protein